MKSLFLLSVFFISCTTTKNEVSQRNLATDETPVEAESSNKKSEMSKADRSKVAFQFRDRALELDFELVIKGRNIADLHKLLNNRDTGLSEKEFKLIAGRGLHYLLVDANFFLEDQKLFLEFLDAFLFSKRVDHNVRNSRGETPLFTVAVHYSDYQGGELVARRFLNDPDVEVNARKFDNIYQAYTRTSLDLVASGAENSVFVDEFLNNERVKKNLKSRRSPLTAVMNAVFLSASPENILKFIRHPEVRLDTRWLGKSIIEALFEGNSHLSDAEKMELTREIVAEAEVRYQALKEAKVKKQQRQALRNLRIEGGKKLAENFTCQY